MDFVDKIKQDGFINGFKEHLSSVILSYFCQIYSGNFSVDYKTCQRNKYKICRVQQIL